MVVEKTIDQIWRERNCEFRRKCPNFGKEGVENCLEWICYNAKSDMRVAEKKGSVCKNCLCSSKEYRERLIESARTRPPKTEETRQKLRITWTEEKRKEYGLKRSGVNAPNYGKKFPKETLEKMSRAHKGKVVNDESRKKMSESQQNRKSPTQETIQKLKDAWTEERREKHGKKISKILKGTKRSEEAKQKQRETRKKQVFTEESKQKMRESALKKPSRGEEWKQKLRESYNPKTRRSSNRNFFSGMYQGIHFRSSCELNFLLKNEDNSKLISAEGKEFRIPYTDKEGIHRFYYPDFFLNDNTIIEIKPPQWHKMKDRDGCVKCAIEKKEAAIKFCAERGWQYLLLESKGIDRLNIFKLRDEGIIKLDKRSEDRYQTWKNLKVIS